MASRNPDAKHAKTGWFLSSEGRLESLELTEHLDWLLDRLQPAAAALRALAQEEGVAMRIACIWWAAPESTGFTISAAQISRLAELGVNVDFGISFYPPESKDS
jgi:hypothetical protein